MKRRFLLFFVLLVAALSAQSQEPTAADPNEGARLIQTGPGTFSYKWWGRSGKSYFVQQKDDLLMPTWLYLPVVGTGGDGVLSLGLSSSNPTGFFRLEILSYDPYTVDTDGDGMPDAYEVLNYLNWKVADGALADLDGDGIPNREDARPNNAAIGRLTISITAPGDGLIYP